MEARKLNKIFLIILMIEFVIVFILSNFGLDKISEYSFLGIILTIGLWCILDIKYVKKIKNLK